MSDDLRTDILLALCTDHGHLNMQGNLSCRTCNRRTNKVLDVLREHSLIP